MWFKNLRIYRFSQPFTLNPEELQPLLEEKAFVPCGSQDATRYGWTSPLGPNEPLLYHACQGAIMLCAQQQDKIVPASVIKEELADKVDALELKEGRKVFRKEKERLKDEVMLELLPRAFTRNQKVFGYISPQDGLLMLDCASPSKAEQFLGHLRDSIGSLPVVLPVTQQIPTDVMTHWLTEQTIPDPFEIDKDCELSNPTDSANVIRCKAQDLDANEIQSLLTAGKRCTKLAVIWNDAIQCLIEDDLSLKRLKFQDELLEKANEHEAESYAEQFDQDFAVMSMELSALCKDLFAAFGGLEPLRSI